MSRMFPGGRLPRLLRNAFVTAAAFAVLGLALVARGGPTVPNDPYDLPQTTAEAPLRTPGTATCTETVLTHTFANSYGSPGYGAHKASACPGPWSFVKLNVDVKVSGVQFDRLFDIYVGKVPMLSSSTSEPASELPGAVTRWQVDADVSRFAGLLASDQPITAILNNVNDNTYTGQYQVKLTLTYYAVGPANPAIVPPDYIGAVFEGDDPKNPGGPGHLGTSGYPELDKMSLSWAHDLSLPRNLLSLEAEVYAQGHGACEEFWWADPGQCSVGTPLRQVVLAIDGVIAGFAPVYPVLFTGGGGPGNWNPIPSPRAWHLDPYRLDLTPFIGRLVDGLPHRFTLSVPDAAFSDGGDYWLVGATLVGTTDKGSAQTSGALTSMPVAAMATTSFIQDDTVTGFGRFTGSRSGAWKGYVQGSAGRIDSEVSNSFDIASNGALAADSTWHWTTNSKTTPAGGTATTTNRAYTYLLQSPGLGGGRFGDTLVTTVTGPKPYSSSYDLQLTTVGSLYVNEGQTETFNASDSSGYCYDRVLTASAGYVTSDTSNITCAVAGGSSSGSTSSSSSGSTSSSSSGSTSSSTSSSSSGSTSSSTSSSSSSSGGGSSGAATSSSGSSTSSSSGGGSSGAIESTPTGSSTTTVTGPAPQGRFGGGAMGLGLLPLGLLGLRRRRRN